MNRVVILTGDLGHAVRKGIVALRDEVPDVQLLVVVHRPVRPLSQLLKNQRRNLQRHGWRWVPHVAAELWQRLDARLRPEAGLLPEDGPGRAYDIEAIARSSEVQLLYVDDLHSQLSIERVRAFKPDLGVSLAAPILRPLLFSIPRLGTLNLHKGKVPEYRGMPPAFWELWNQEKVVGCTVHVVEEKLDTGPIIREDTVHIEAHSTLRGLQLTLDELGVRMVCQAVCSVIDGSAVPIAQRSGGRTFRKPTLLQERTLRARFEREALATVPKDVFFRAYGGASQLSRRMRAWRARPRVVVLLYHRVNDAMRDSLTIGIEHFERQMAHLARRCCVLDIQSVVSGDYDRTTACPIVAVTFDDGYRDNYENAVPILLRHRIPAAFFVSTGMVNVDGPFDHDLRKLGHGLPTMKWDQLREMKQAGFTIGSHSVTHLDCGSADLGTVRDELRESKRALAREVGVTDPIFAYPFGGQKNMTPQALELVREEGFSGCLSAYGGRNDGAVDPFNVRRVGIDDNFTDSSFRARLEGWC